MDIHTRVTLPDGLRRDEQQEAQIQATDGQYDCVFD